MTFDRSTRRASRKPSWIRRGLIAGALLASASAWTAAPAAADGWVYESTPGVTYTTPSYDVYPDRTYYPSPYPPTSEVYAQPTAPAYVYRSYPEPRSGFFIDTPILSFGIGNR